MEGILVFEGSTIKPPFIVRHEADRVFVNEVQVYPPVEVEEVPKLAAEEDVFSATEKSSTLEMFDEVEQTMEEFASVTAETWAEFKAASFEQKSKKVKDFLEEKGYKTELSSTYQDLLVPITDDFGVVALFNEEARIQVMQEAGEEPKTVFEYDVAKDLAECIESNLELGHFLRLENNVLEAIPKEELDAIADDLEKVEGINWRDLEYDQKVAKFAEGVVKASVIKPPCSAVIFFPHRSWQKEAVGQASSYWSTLGYKLLAEGYWVRTYLDKAVTLERWANILANGSAQNLRVIYNEGHGSDDLICVGEPQLKSNWKYFRSSFVKNYAKLRNTVVYIHSCATMSDLKMASAFCGKGACTYLGWKHNTSANPNYCDKIDALFWEPMIDLNSTAIYAKTNVATVDTDLYGYGNRYCRIPIKKWEC
jgi:hypothetical protein